MGLFAVAYALYVGVELAWAAGNRPTWRRSGCSAATASLATSAFWLGLTAGRFLIAPVALRVAPEPIVLACSGLAILTLGLAAIPGLAPVAYAATGLVIAPIYPTGLSGSPR